jgi:hypothetical protein
MRTSYRRFIKRDHQFLGYGASFELPRPPPMNQTRTLANL